MIYGINGGLYTEHTDRKTVINHASFSVDYDSRERAVGDLRRAARRAGLIERTRDMKSDYLNAAKKYEGLKYKRLLVAGDLSLVAKEIGEVNIARVESLLVELGARKGEQSLVDVAEHGTQEVWPKGREGNLSP